jgi:hypothetical protein
MMNCIQHLAADHLDVTSSRGLQFDFPQSAGDCSLISLNQLAADWLKSKHCSC